MDRRARLSEAEITVGQNRPVHHSLQLLTVALWHLFYTETLRHVEALQSSIDVKLTIESTRCVAVLPNETNHAMSRFDVGLSGLDEAKTAWQRLYPLMLQ